MTESISYPIPQVGAILHLDTQAPYQDIEHGNKHWRLDGSCVLVAPDKVLTIRHNLLKRGRHAVFFPFEGIIPLEPDWVFDSPSDDPMALCQLARPVRYFPGLDIQFLDKTTLHEAAVCGYGRWDGRENWERDGLHRGITVELHDEGWENGGAKEYGCDDDLFWSLSRNGNIAASRNNSGGPILLQGIDRYTVLGVLREANGEGLFASRIDKHRARWLTELLRMEPRYRLRDPLLTYRPETTTITADRLTTVAFDIPRLPRCRCPEPEAVDVLVTLSATSNLRLQMGFGWPGDQDAWLHKRLRTDDRSSGRFLVRRKRLRARQGETFKVGISAVDGAQVAGDGTAEAQVCCMLIQRVRPRTYECCTCEDCRSSASSQDSQENHAAGPREDHAQAA